MPGGYWWQEWRHARAALAAEAGDTSRDWAAADQMRETLRSQGVEVLDKERLWKTADGRIGLLGGQLAEPEIRMLVQMREQERQSRNFEAADRLRQAREWPRARRARRPAGPAGLLVRSHQ